MNEKVGSTEEAKGEKELRKRLALACAKGRGISYGREDTKLLYRLLSNLYSVEARQDAARTPYDPVRRDREGWEAGVKAAIKRLQEDADEWTQELSKPLTPHEVRFITKRILQIKTHIAQIGELKYGK